MKRIVKEEWNTKFRPWRVTFFLFLVPALTGFSFGVFSLAKGFLAPFHSLILKIAEKETLFFCPDALYLLLPFLAGITLYAPAVSALTVFFIFDRLALSFYPLFKEQDFLTSSVTFIFGMAEGYVYLLYASFITLSSLILYRDISAPFQNGALFHTKAFKGRCNTRALFSYLGFFLFFYLICLALALIKQSLLHLI